MAREAHHHPNYGGSRANAGRPKGSGHKIKLEDLLKDIESEVGMPYSRRLAINYSEAIDREDWSKVENYDRAFLNKIVADKQEVEIVEVDDQVRARQQAFAEAIARIVAGQEPSISAERLNTAEKTICH